MPTTLLQVRERIKRRTDNEYTDGFIEDGEIDDLINLHYKRLYALLQRTGLQRPETDYAIAADGSSSYALPADLYAVFAVFRLLDDGTPEYLTRHDQRNRPGPHQTDACTYRVKGLSVEFIPTPSTGNYVVSYIPVPGDLVDDDDALDGVLGWEEYVVLAASVDVMVKESDPSMIGHVQGQLQAIRAEIRTEARNVEMSEAPCVQDTRSRGNWPNDTGHRNIRPAGWPWGY